VLEVRAGTGQLAQALLEADLLRVVAIEPGPDMAKFLARRFGRRGGFRVVQSAFVDMALQHGSFAEWRRPMRPLGRSGCQLPKGSVASSPSGLWSVALELPHPGHGRLPATI
jgi:hypothetical protein